MLKTQTQERTPWWNKRVIYWLTNQVAITFHSPLDRSEGVEKIIASLKLNELNGFLHTGGFSLKPFTAKDVPHPEDTSRKELEQFEAYLEVLEAELESFERQAHHHSPFSLFGDGQTYKTPRERAIEELEERIEALEREIEKREHATRDVNQQNGNTSDENQQDGDTRGERKSRDVNSPTGKYLFHSPAGQGTVVVCFFHGQSTQVDSSMPHMSSMGGGSKNAMKQPDITPALVTYINRNLDMLRQDGHIPIVAAMPNWIGGGTQINPDVGIGHGCPITPPIPVSGDNTCASHSGSWPITLSQLSPTMQEMKGEGVTVFVLDSIPALDDIRSAAQRAGDNNALLKDMVARMDSKTPSLTPPAITPASIIIDHQSVPANIATSIQTGKDIFGRLFGFNMPDHGLFVAGIVHDLAPKARIECVRVLNDFGIGTFSIICKALEDIQTRMETEAEKLGQVVINLSLVITPADEELAGIWFGNDGSCQAGDLASMMYEVKLVRTGLQLVIQSLTALGAVVVASAGNDSNADGYYRSMGMSMGTGMPARLGPRYPAAFPEVISVGAVTKDGEAAAYSDFPALPPNHNGVATYGGGIPTAVPPAILPAAAPQAPAGTGTWAIVTDALIGVYSSPTYPKLSAEDTPPPPADYPAPLDNNAWAYWSGTSFATPIISAVAARVLQGLQAGSIVSSKSVQDIITTASGQQAILASGTTLNSTTGFGLGVSVLKAEQLCSPVESEAVGAGSGGVVVSQE